MHGSWNFGSACARQQLSCPHPVPTVVTVRIKDRLGPRASLNQWHVQVPLLLLLESRDVTITDFFTRERSLLHRHQKLHWQNACGYASRPYICGVYACLDPRVADFFMMSSPWSSLIICLLYVVAVEWALPRFMDNRKPLEFRALIVAYNFAMVLLSGYIFVEVSQQYTSLHAVDTHLYRSLAWLVGHINKVDQRQVGLVRGWVALDRCVNHFG